MRWCRSAFTISGANWVFCTSCWRRKSVSQKWAFLALVGSLAIKSVRDNAKANDRKKRVGDSRKSMTHARSGGKEIDEFESTDGLLDGVISFFVLFVALDLKKSHNINRLGIA